MTLTTEQIERITRTQALREAELEARVNPTKDFDELEEEMYNTYMDPETNTIDVACLASILYSYEDYDLDNVGKFIVDDCGLSEEVADEFLCTYY